MQIKLMLLLLLLLLLLRIMGIKHFYDFSFKKDYSILYEKGQETKVTNIPLHRSSLRRHKPTSKFTINNIGLTEL